MAVYLSNMAATMVEFKFYQEISFFFSISFSTMAADPGVCLKLSDRERFCNIFRISGRSFGPKFGFPYMFYTFKLLPQLKIGRSQPELGDFFSQIAP